LNLDPERSGKGRGRANRLGLLVLYDLPELVRLVRTKLLGRKVLFELGVAGLADVGREVGVDKVVHSDGERILLGLLDDPLRLDGDTRQVVGDVGSRCDDEPESFKVGSSFRTRSPEESKRKGTKLAIGRFGSRPRRLSFSHSPVDALPSSDNHDLVKEVVDLVSSLVWSSKAEGKTWTRQFSSFPLSFSPLSKREVPTHKARRRW